MAPWSDILGPVLSVHDGHGHTNFDRFMPTCRVLPTCEVLRGQTSVGLYFSADWCAPCAGFTPILNTFYKKRKKLGPERSPFEVVLVSRCKTKANTKQYFSNMPWTAMAHKDSMGSRGQELMAKFGVVTIPALVLLDGMGAVTCRDGQQWVIENPTGLQFPWKGDTSLPPNP
jgi:thiol-disulfide isomerase/thioredoxin